MKRNVLRLLPIIVGIGLCAYSPSRLVTIYMCYDGFSSQTNIASYYQTSTHPGLVSGDTRLYWFVVNDNNGIVTASEFAAAFDSYDTNSNNTLNDESEIDDKLEKMEVVF